MTKPCRVADEQTWSDVGALDAIPRQGSRTVASAVGDIAVFRSVDDQVFALLDRCPHKNGPLSQGIVHGSRVTCPLHSWVIELQSGQAVAPDQGCARQFPVKLEDGRVWLDMAG
ncbi:MAG: nitrite reductase small subunit NirD [Methylococcaceae bacterium]|nr:MAG: nitrite reductase small subunit NirD [Methylococcaceae bacterium]